MPPKERKVRVGHQFDSVKETLSEDLEAATEMRDEIQEAITELEAELVERHNELTDAQATVDRLTVLYNAEP